MPKKRRYLSNTKPIARTDKTNVVKVRTIDPRFVQQVDPYVYSPYSDNVYDLHSEINAAQGFPTYRYSDSIADRRLQEYLYKKDNPRMYKPYEVEDAERDYEMWKALSIGAQPSKWSLKPRRK